MHTTLFPIFAILAAVVLADVKFTTPAPGVVASSNTQLSITWSDGGGDYPLSKMKAYTIFLMLGGDTETTSQPVANVAGDHSADKSKSKIMTIPSPSVGPVGQNAYFLKMESSTSTGATVINYSERFTMPGMTGEWPPNTPFEDAWKEVKGDITAVPATQVQGGDAAAAPAGAGAVAGAGGPQFAVPFAEQTTGLIMYAPMMNYPGSAITKTATGKLNPASPWHIATTYLPAASQVQTVTAAGTHVATTRKNTAAAETTDTNNDMAKWLKRWRD